MTDTSQLWYSLNKDCGDIPRTPVESCSDSKEQTNKFSDDIAALSQKFPQLASLLATNKNEQELVQNYNTTLIIKSQKTK